MVRTGRVLCITTPFILSVVALLCLIVILLAGTIENDKTTGGLYLYKIDTTTLKVHTNNTTVSIPSNAKNEMGIQDHYAVYLRNYCSWSAQSKAYSTCLKPSGYFWFDPVSVWSKSKQDINITASLSIDFSDGLTIYERGSKDMLLLYYMALATTSLTILAGLTAIFSRWGSFVTNLCATGAAITYCGATAVAAGVSQLMEETMNKELQGPNGIATHRGKQIIYVSALGSLLSVIAVFFWFLSVFCCSGRSPYSERDRRSGAIRPLTAEKAPYTYERIGKGGTGGNGDGETPLIQGQLWQGEGSAYEPFRPHVVQSA